MRSVISVKTSQTSHQSIFAGLTDQSPIMEHRHQPDQDCSTWHSTVTTILKFFNSARSHPELLSVLIIAGYGIPCTYGNIAYIDINCKNNRQMPAAWKVWRIGVKILFVFPSLPAPSQCPQHSLHLQSAIVLAGRPWWANRKTEELELGLTLGQLFCFSN